MADMVFNSNYAGTAAVPFVAPAILSADTIANGYCSVLDNVRYKTNLRKVDRRNRRGLALATLTPRHTVPWTSDDVQLVTLTELQVNEEICNHELAQILGRGADARSFRSRPR